MASVESQPVLDWRLLVPDDVLLRRFGYVRAVGGAAWFLLVGVMWAQYGTQVWPLALGVPILAVVTTGYFVRSHAYPRTLVIASLIADALVLAGGIAFFGGTGAGLVMAYSIVVVSAGIMLGPSSATAFTAGCVALGFMQLGLEALGLEPLLFRPELSQRLPILLASVAGLASVGYLSATYASRLHELIAIAGREAEQVRVSGRRRRSYVQRSVAEVRGRLAELDQLADSLDAAPQDADAARHTAARLRLGVSELESEVDVLADAADMDALRESRPEPISLSRVVQDCIVALGSRLEGYSIERDMPQLRVVGDRRAARRVVYNLLDNVVEHTPPGTRVHIAARTGGAAALLVVTDSGPGIPADVAEHLFDPPIARDDAPVGLPLVRELCETMGADIRYEPAPGGGARFVLRFRLAPPSAPTAEEAADDRRQAAGP